MRASQSRESRLCSPGDSLTGQYLTGARRVDMRQPGHGRASRQPVILSDRTIREELRIKRRTLTEGRLELTKARLPWLVLALLGGFITVKVMGVFDQAMEHHKELFFFTPLIAAMAGNVGVQSSAIIVQGLANNTLSGSLWNRLIKEVSLTLLNGLILAVILFLGSYFLLDESYAMGLTVGISLISVIVIASLIGTFMPIMLNKFGIDPALATGPFITTSNDIFGILIYFSIAKAVLGF